MINSVLVKFVTVPAPPSDLRVLPGFQKSGSNAGNCNRTSNSLVRAVQTILWLQEKVDIKNLFFLWSETALSCASVWFWDCASSSQIFGSSPAFRKAAATPPTTHVHQIIRSDQYKRLKVYSSASRIWLEKNIHYNKNNRKAIKSIIFDVWFFLTPSKYIIHLTFHYSEKIFFIHFFGISINRQKQGDHQKPVEILLLSVSLSCLRL